MPILRSSNSAVNKDMMSKIWINADKLLVTSNFFFSHIDFKSCQVLMCQNEYLWSKGLRKVEYIRERRK